MTHHLLLRHLSIEFRFSKIIYTEIRNILQNIIFTILLNQTFFYLRKRAEMVATQQKAAEKLTAKAVGREFVRQVK